MPRQVGRADAHQDESDASEHRQGVRAQIAMTARDYLSLLDQFDRAPIENEATLRVLHRRLTVLEDVLRAQLSRLQD